MLLEIQFDITLLRQHLAKCLEDGKFQPFMKTSLKRSLCRKKQIQVVEILTDCGKCSLTNAYDDMIGCMRDGCDTWYHKRCVNVNGSVSESMDFRCQDCG